MVLGFELIFKVVEIKISRYIWTLLSWSSSYRAVFFDLVKSSNLEIAAGFCRVSIILIIIGGRATGDRGGDHYWKWMWDGWWN